MNISFLPFSKGFPVATNTPKITTVFRPAFVSLSKFILVPNKLFHSYIRITEHNLASLLNEINQISFVLMLSST